MLATNATPEAINARSVADNLNAQDPHERAGLPPAGGLGFRNLTNHIARSLRESGGSRPQLHPQL